MRSYDFTLNVNFVTHQLVVAIKIIGNILLRFQMLQAIFVIDQ